MARGWVYVITNPAIPGLVKIGFSLKDPIFRARKLNNIGTPHPYVVRYDALVAEPRNLERALHQFLSTQREGKEWFRLTVAEAVRQIRSAATSKILLESGNFDEPTFTEAEVPPEPEVQAQASLDDCTYEGCDLEAEREINGSRYCLWHFREVRNPRRAASIRLLREEYERDGS